MAKAVGFTNLAGWDCEGTLWIDLPKAFAWGGGLKACVDQNDPSLLEVRGGSMWIDWQSLGDAVWWVLNPDA